MKQTDWMSILQHRGRQVWLRLTPPVRAILILAVVGAATAIPIGQAMVHHRRVWLFDGGTIAMPQIQRMESAWAGAGLGDYDIVGGRVRVPAQSKGKYLMALVEANAMPPSLGSEWQQAADQVHVLESPAQRKVRLQLVRDQQLANIIKSIEGVEDAIIRIEESAPHGLREQSTKKAMVVVQPTAGTILRPDRVQTIRNLVANSSMGLIPTEVSVTDLGLSFVYHGELSTAAMGAPAWAISKWRKDYELEWESRVAALLDPMATKRVMATATLSDGELQPCEVQILVEVPKSLAERKWKLESDSAKVAAKPTAKDLEQAETEIKREISERLSAMVTHPGKFPASENVAGRTQTSFQVVLVDDQRTDSFFPAKFSWDQPNSAVAMGIIAMAILGVVVIGIGFVRDLLQTRPSAKKSPSVARTTHGVEPVAATDAQVLSHPSHRTENNDPSSQKTEVIQAELATLMRDNPKAAADLLRRWAQEAA
jgi:Secretory protein of YscJ/FliF family